MAKTLNTMTVNISPSPGVYNTGTASVVVTTSPNVETVVIAKDREPTIAQVLARDQYGDPFIVVYDDGYGKVTFDGGFPKFYNRRWNGASLYENYPVSFKYLVNVVNFIKDTNRSNKVLIFSTSVPGESYTVGDQTNPNLNSASFHVGMPAALSNQGFEVVRKTSADFGWYSGSPNGVIDIPFSELTQYCAVIFMSTHSSWTNRISPATADNFVQYQQSGGGIFIVTDHDAFQYDANRLANRFGANFHGFVNRTSSNPTYIVGNIIAANGLHPIWDNIPLDQSLPADTSEGAIDASSDPIYEGGNYDLDFGYQKVHILVKSNTGIIERTEFDYLVAGDLDVDFPDLTTPTLKPYFTPNMTAKRWKTNGIITKGDSAKQQIYINDENITYTNIDPTSDGRIPLTPDINKIKVKFNHPFFEEEFTINRKTYNSINDLKLATITNTIDELELENLNKLNPAKAYSEILNVTELPRLSPAKTNQNILKYFKPQTKIQNEALIVDNELDLANLTGKRYRIRTYGYGVTQLPWTDGPPIGFYDTQKETMIAYPSRSYIISFLNQFGEWEHNRFDPYGNSQRQSLFTGKTITQAEAMSEYLKYINDNFEGTPVVIYTYDEPMTNRFLNDIKNEIYRMGASPEVFEHQYFNYRACYVLLGQANIGQGKGAEFLNGIRPEYAGQTSSGDPNAIMDISFNIRNGAIVINGTHITDFENIISEDPIIIDSTSSGIEPPTFETIFNNWDRFDRYDYFKAGETISQRGTPLSSTQANTWVYNSSTDQVLCTVNSEGLTGFVSNEKLSHYKHAATIASTSTDDDMIGIIMASAMKNNEPIHIIAVRTNGGMFPHWAIVVAQEKVNHPGHPELDPTATILVDGSNKPGIIENLKTNGAKAGWQESGPIRIWTEREGNVFRAWTSQAGDPTLTKDEATMIECVIDETLPEFYNKKHSYGYICQSQPNSTFSDIEIEGSINYTQVWDAKTMPPTLYEYNQATNTWEESSGDIFEIVGDNTETLNPLTGKTFTVYKLGNQKNISSID